MFFWLIIEKMLFRKTLNTLLSNTDKNNYDNSCEWGKSYFSLLWYQTIVLSVEFKLGAPEPEACNWDCIA